MKGKDLFANIQEAREQITRLKKQAATFQQSLNEHTANASEYVNEAVYCLMKKDQEIERKHRQFKHKLPSINNRNIEAVQGVYKRPRRGTQGGGKKELLEESTKDQSVSFSVENRPMKMHSFQEKHLRVEFNSDRNNIPLIDVQIPELETANLRRLGSVSSQFRKRQLQKKTLKFIDLNKSNQVIEDSALNSPLPKDYAGMVDKYSQHEFMIIDGKLIADTPQFTSFQRIFSSSMPRIQSEINKLQTILQEKEIHFVTLMGKKLAYLCLKQEISKMELISCLKEYDTIKYKMAPESKYVGRQGRLCAATKISAFWKMKSIQQKYQTLKRSTIVIQRFFRSNLLRLDLQRRIIQNGKCMIEQFEERQEKLGEQWKTIKNQKRIQIHLNSVQVDQQKRLTIENYAQRQNIQLSRIFRLKDDKLIIIYVTPVQLPLELVNYYYKMLELVGITDYADRLIFITPDAVGKFQGHLSTTKVLYYSSRTLNQLRTIIADLPTIIYAGHPCNQLLKISNYLQCYLFSGNPQKMKCFTTKSQTNRFLKNLTIDTLPSTMEMYDYGEFLNTFSVLIVKNPSVETWLLKIDDEFGGRGIAHFSISSSKTLRSILRRIDRHSESNVFATNITQDTHNQQLTVRVRDYLKEHLHQKLQLATPAVYRSYTHFIGRFIKKGGIIEAEPEYPRDELTFPSVSFCLEPDGQFHIVTTYEKIMGNSFRGIGCAFPQKSVDFADLNSLCRKVCESLKIRKIFGNFTLDIVSHKQSSRWWVIDMDPYINDYTSSYYLFDLLMTGSFFPEKNLYLIQHEDTVSHATKQSETMSSEATSDTLVTNRQYIFLPHFYNEGLTKVKIKQFFKQARIQQFNFDISYRIGMCILLLDQLTSGVMGLLAVAEKRDEAEGHLRKVLDFITRISAGRSLDYGKSQLHTASDIITLKDVQSKFVGLERNANRRNAKQRALKNHLNNQNLVLL